MAALALLVLPVRRAIPAVLAVNAVLWLAFAAAGPALNLLAVAGSNESEWAGRLASLNAYQGYGWAGGLVLGLVWTTAVGRVLGGLATLGSLSVACGLSTAVAA
ncbi:MFS transporter, partial [Halobacteriales archaeon QH_10_70_21]